MKMQDKIKNRKLIINKYVKIINSTKKEYESKATTSAVTVTQSHIFYLLLI